MDDNDEEAIIRCGTTKGDVTLRLFRKWSPNGYDRAVGLFEKEFYDNSHFYRVVPKFLVQFGISYTKDTELVSYSKRSIQDDPKQEPPIQFEPGTISFAGSGKNSRTSQLFISYGSAQSLGTQLWETPIGKVISGLNNAENFHSYGDMPPWGKGPVQGKIHGHPEYIEENFPLTDKFLHCDVKRSSTVVVDANADSLNDVHHQKEGEVEEKNNDPFTGTDSSTQSNVNEEVEATVLRRKIARNKEDKFFAIPQEKLGIRKSENRNITNTGNSNSFVVTAIAILVLLGLIVFYVTNGRRKLTSKRN